MFLRKILPWLSLAQGKKDLEAKLEEAEERLQALHEALRILDKENIRLKKALSEKGKAKADG